MRGVRLALEAPDHQKKNDHVGVTWKTFKTITHSIMVYARVSDEYINFVLMYMADNIFTVLPIKQVVNQDGKPTTPHKMATGTKPAVSNLCVLFCPCVVRDATEHVDTKALNMCHHPQKGFSGIFVGIP